MQLSPLSQSIEFHFIYTLLSLTNASTASSAVTGTSAAACSIICAVVVATSTSVIAVVGIIAVASIATAVNWTIGRAAGCYCGRPAAPFADSMPDAAPKSSFSFPSCACGYQSITCCGTP